MGVFKCLMRDGELDKVFLPNYLKRNRNCNKRRSMYRISLRYSTPKLKNIRPNIKNLFLFQDFRYIRNIALRELLEQERSSEQEILTMQQYANKSEFYRIKQMNE